MAGPLTLIRRRSPSRWLASAGWALVVAAACAGWAMVAAAAFAAGWWLIVAEVALAGG